MSGQSEEEVTVTYPAVLCKASAATTYTSQWTPRHCPFIEMWVTVDHSDKYPVRPLSPSSTPVQTEQVPQPPRLAFYMVYSTPTGQVSSQAQSQPRTGRH